MKHKRESESQTTHSQSQVALMEDIKNLYRLITRVMRFIAINEKGNTSIDHSGGAAHSHIGHYDTFQSARAGSTGGHTLAKRDLFNKETVVSGMTSLDKVTIS